MTEAEMFKQMETGKLLAEDVLPKVAKEYARVARENGALGEAMKKNRSELNRFMNSLIDIKNTIYTGGFGQGLNYAFKGMTNFLMSSKDLAKVLGQVLKGAMIGLTVPFEILGILIKKVSDAFDIGNSDVIRYTANILGLVAAMYALYRIGKLVASVFGAMKGISEAVKKIPSGSTSVAAKGLMGKAGALGAGVTAGYSIYDYLTNTLPEGLKTGGSTMALVKSGMLDRPVSWGRQPQQVDVNVKVNDGKVKDLITAEVQQNNTENLNSLLSSGTR